MQLTMGVAAELPSEELGTRYQVLSALLLVYTVTVLQGNKGPQEQRP